MKILLYCLTWPDVLSVAAKTVVIYDPLQEPEVHEVTFADEAKFESWLGELK